MTPRLFDVITVGDLCVDLIVDLGTTMPAFGQVEQWVSDYHLEMGGSTAIFACQAARLGLRTAILGRVGADAYGELVLARLHEAGVDTRFVSVDVGLKTGLGVALSRSDGDRSILTYAGSLNAVHISDITSEFLGSGGHLHYGSYYLQTNLIRQAPGILRLARELGLTISLDTNWDPEGGWDGGVADCLRLTDVFLPNEREALAITGAAEIGRAADLLSTIVPVTAIKRGPRGALVVQGSDRLEVGVEAVSAVVDTTGAGDCFDAGFVAGWLGGLPLDRCAAIGNACGRASTQRPGGVQGQLTRADIPELVAEG